MPEQVVFASVADLVACHLQILVQGAEAVPHDLAETALAFLVAAAVVAVGHGTHSGCHPGEQSGEGDPHHFLCLLVGSTPALILAVAGRMFPLEEPRQL